MTPAQAYEHPACSPTKVYHTSSQRSPAQPRHPCAKGHKMILTSGVSNLRVSRSQVVIKKEYQDQRRTKDPRLLDGRAWYNLQAFRAVNQAVGRQARSIR